MSLKWYDEEGRALSRDRWLALYGEQKDRQMADDTVWGIWRVSTVLLGLDHAFGRSAGPLIFETMIFRRGKWEGLWEMRWRSKEEALQGHEEAVRMVHEPAWVMVQAWKEVKEGWRGSMERLREIVDELLDWVHKRVG